MEDKKDHQEKSGSVQPAKLDSNIEELENRDAPKLVANHNETMLESDM